MFKIGDRVKVISSDPWDCQKQRSFKGKTGTVTSEGSYFIDVMLDGGRPEIFLPYEIEKV